MSGSDRGSGVGGGGTGVEPACENLRFEALLTSPKAAVVATLTVGEVLDVATEDLNGQLVVVVRKGVDVAGGLAGPDIGRLRGCMEHGHVYHATVRSINGGQVRVKVEHAG